MSPESIARAFCLSCLLLLTVYNLECRAAQNTNEINTSAAKESSVQASDALASPEPEKPENCVGEDKQITPATPDATDIASLEQKYFGSNFDRDSLNDRIGRIEKFVFGSPQKGENEIRLQRLLKVLNPRKNTISAQAVGQESSSHGAAQNNDAKWVEQTVQSKDMKTGQPSIANSGGQTANIQNAPPPNSAVPKKKNLLAIINRGIDNYNRHRYHNAEDDFNEAVDMAPGLARIYAYLGVTLLQLNERTSAMDAMQAAYELDPFGTFGRYAKNCLIVLAGDEEIRRRGPRDDKKTVDKVLEKINRQASSDAGRFSKGGSVAANDRNITSSRFTNRLASEFSGYSDVSNDYSMRSSYARSDAAVQSANAHRDATLRAASAREAANNLKMLLTTKILPGGSRLRAFGTTLNTRYYGSETRNLAPWYIPREYPPELKAQAKSLKMQTIRRTTKRTATKQTTASVSKQKSKYTNTSRRKSKR